MVCVVGVRFRIAGKLTYYEVDPVYIGQNTTVIAETARGIEYGRIVLGPREVAEQDVVLTSHQIIRVADEDDAKTAEQNQQKAKKAIEHCRERILYRNMQMKLVDCEYTFDCNRVIFYFTADGRIDFRELVKDLASLLRTRIELRQIGVRDEAKLLGGIGPCGRIVCCSSWLGDFVPVSIKMAKDQHLSLNPIKISGLCGRLMCCLKYEQDHYESALEQLPFPGAVVMTSRGEGVVLGVDVLQRMVRIRLQDKKEEVMLDADDVTEFDPSNMSM